MKKDIYIKQSDLISDTEPFNYRYRDRFSTLQEFLFKYTELDNFYSSLKRIRDKAGVTPLGNKIEKITNNLISYLYVVEGLSVSDLSTRLGMKPSKVCWHLLYFFSPIYEDISKLNFFFQVNDLSPNVIIKDFSEFKSFLGETRSGEEIFSLHKNLQLKEILESPGWDLISLSVGKKKLDISTQLFVDKFSLFKLMSFTFALLLMGVLLFVSIQINSYNELKLLSKVSIPSRFFTWLDNGALNSVETLFRKEGADVDNALVSRPDNTASSPVEEDRFDVESDVVLTSLDQIQSGEFSSLTENQRGSFRDTRYGNQKVYRLMIASTDVIELSNRIAEIMDKYNAIKGGSVEAGSNLPGGLYYNLLVPTDSLTQFFSELDKSENVTIYLSKSKMSAPEGKSNVFIWAKKI